MQYIALCILSSLCVNAAHAFEVKATATSNTEYTNNLNNDRFGVDKVEDTLEQLSLNFQFEERRKKFTATLDTKFLHETYLNNSFSDKNEITAGLGLINFEIIESFLDWKSSYRRTRILKDEDEADTPDNQEIRDVYVTGPSIYYELNKLTHIVISSEFIQTEISDPDVSDSQRTSSRAMIRRVIDPVTTSAANANVSDNDG